MWLVVGVVCGGCVGVVMLLCVVCGLLVYCCWLCVCCGLRCVCVCGVFVALFCVLGVCTCFVVACLWFAVGVDVCVVVVVCGVCVSGFALWLVCVLLLFCFGNVF